MSETVASGSRRHEAAFDSAGFPAQIRRAAAVCSKCRLLIKRAERPGSLKDRTGGLPPHEKSLVSRMCGDCLLTERASARYVRHAGVGPGKRCSAGPGCCGNPVIRAPDIYRLAGEGQRWTSFCASGHYSEFAVFREGEAPAEPKSFGQEQLRLGGSLALSKIVGRRKLLVSQPEIASCSL